MKQFRLLFLISILLIGKLSLAQDFSDTIIESRRSAVDYLEISRGAIVDTTLDNLKELVSRQQTVIDVDDIIIEQNLPDIIAKAEESKTKAETLAKEKEALDKELSAKNDLIFYGIIGAGSLFVLMLLFLILFIISSSKKKKLKKVVVNIDKMKEANFREIEASRNELECEREKAKGEIMTLKEKIDKEAVELRYKLTNVTTEKAEIATKLAIAEKKILDSQSVLQTAINQKNQFDQHIQEKDLIIADLKKEIESRTKDSNEIKELFEKKNTDFKALEDKMLNLSKDSQDTGFLNSELAKAKEELNRLTEEVSTLNTKLGKETQTKNLIEDELRRFLDELRGNR